MNTRPNILFIMTDDHAAHAISAYGSKLNTTPNLDRIAIEGMRFDNCYVTNSICTPSRAAILTGTYNHVNGVTTLDTHIDNRLPNVAKHLRTGGYQTAMVGKWHLGQGPDHEPTGFDYWNVVPGQGLYNWPEFIGPDGKTTDEGYVTDVITDKSINWLKKRDKDRPFFMMCHHKAPHRPWDPKAEHRKLYMDPIPEPETFDDDYSNRARAAKDADMRIADDLTYDDLDLVQLAESPGTRAWGDNRRIPNPETPEELADFSVRCRNTGRVFTFSSARELKSFKYQRYMRKYLQTIHSVDENVGRLLDWLEEEGLSENTMVIYTSDQGFFLGDHGWFDKRFIYEESLKMPFLVRYPKSIKPGSVNTDLACNVDFAPTFLELAGLMVPSYMQGRSLLPLMERNTPEDWQEEVYHRYWMNRDEIHNAYAHYGIRTKQYKLVYWYDEDCGQAGSVPGQGITDWELFDLEADPWELNNVAENPAYTAIRKDLQRRLEEKMAKIGDEPVH